MFAREAMLTKAAIKKTSEDACKNICEFDTLTHTLSHTPKQMLSKLEVTKIKKSDWMTNALTYLSENGKHRVDPNTENVTEIGRVMSTVAEILDRLLHTNEEGNLATYRCWDIKEFILNLEFALQYFPDYNANAWNINVASSYIVFENIKNLEVPGVIHPLNGLVYKMDQSECAWTFSTERFLEFALNFPKTKHDGLKFIPQMKKDLQFLLVIADGLISRL